MDYFNMMTGIVGLQKSQFMIEKIKSKKAVNSNSYEIEIEDLNGEVIEVDVCEEQDCVILTKKN